MDMNNGKWIGFYTDPSYDESECDRKFGAPAAYLYKKFNIHKAVSRATLECCALGVYAVYVNGSAVEGFLEPGFTDYDKRIYSRKYDVTSLLVGGRNAFGACIGDGWYTGNVAMVRRQRFGKYPLKFLAGLEIVYRDGEVQSVVTDGSWSGTTGAVRENDILNGETRDFRLPHDRIFTADYPDGCKVDELTHCVSPQPSDFESVKLCEKFSPVYLKRGKSEALVDFGQNMAGVLHIRIQGAEGTRVTLRHGEVLTEDGELYTENLRSALNTDTLILSGGEDDFVPLFSYHGFRYAQICADAPVNILFLEARAVHNDLRKTGTFSCSSPLVNRIFQNTWWGMNSNFVSIPTDCPQRDERLGWLADAHLFARTAMYNADCEKFYRKFLRDVSDAATEDGVADYAPYVNIFGRNNGGWADGMVILPYFHYRTYGDKSIIYENLEGMRKHIRASLKTTKNGIREQSVYGDWLNIGADTPLDLFCTAYHYYSLSLYLYLLREIGEDDASVCEQKDLTYSSFQNTMVDSEGRVKGDTQTGYVLSYAFGLLSKEFAAKHLRRKFEENGMRLTTGFNGGRYLLPVLSELGLDDIAYTLILNEEYPGWGYSIANGATTIWERWNSFTPDEGFCDAGMNSFNHYVFGSCVEWLYRYVLGIRENEPGFSSVIIAPRFDPYERITSAEGEYDSRCGRIKVNWELVKGEYFFSVQCPSEMRVRFDFGTAPFRLVSEKDGKYLFRIGASCEETA